MKTVAVNAAVIIWVSLLIFAPSLAWAVHKRPSALVFAGGGAGTLVVVSAITYITGFLGAGSITSLRILAVILGGILAWTALRSAVLVLRRKQHRCLSTDWVALPLGLCLGIWAELPALLTLHRQHLTFGLTSLGNNDLPNYVLIAQNVSVAGFHDSHHITNFDLGFFSRRRSYVGATGLINFVQAATGLSAAQAAMATMGIAIAILAVALWALGRAIWPTAPYSVGMAVVISCLASLSTYIYAEYFLGSILGLASVATALAGATALARQPQPQALLAMTTGGSLGIYSYAHLGLPVLPMLPVWSLLAALIAGIRSHRQLRAIVVRTIAAVVSALLLSAIALPDSVHLVKDQSRVQAGWPLPPLPSSTAIVWPIGIGSHTSRTFVIVSWLVIGAVVVIAFVAAWRRGLRIPVGLASVLTAACAIVTIGAIGIYGSRRYQTWKMEAFLLPLSAVIAIPAFAASSFGPRRFGRSIIAAATGVAILGPFSLWPPQPPANPVATLVFTSTDLMNLRTAPALSNIAALNIKLPTPFDEMSAGAILEKSRVTFVQNSYYPSATDPGTCTLTTASLLAPGETNFTDLGGGYVLIDKPSPCAMKR